MSLASGQCLCGEVHFQARLPSKWVAHCHCTQCQRSGGSAFVTWVGMDETGCTNFTSPGPASPTRSTARRMRMSSGTLAWTG